MLKFVYDRLILAYPKTVLLVILLVIAFLGYEARKLEIDASVRVIVVQFHVRLAGGHFDAELFGQFALECSRRRLTDLDFSTRELPESVKRTIAATFSDQNMVSSVAQNARSDVKVLHRSRFLNSACRDIA